MERDSHHQGQGPYLSLGLHQDLPARGERPYRSRSERETHQTQDTEQEELHHEAAHEPRACRRGRLEPGGGEAALFTACWWAIA